MNLGVRCRAARPYLEGSESRNRLSGGPARPVFLCWRQQRCAQPPDPDRAEPATTDSRSDEEVVWDGYPPAPLGRLATVTHGSARPASVAATPGSAPSHSAPAVSSCCWRPHVTRPTRRPLAP